jgi:hypothetical protein
MAVINSLPLYAKMFVTVSHIKLNLIFAGNAKILGRIRNTSFSL